ncbi:TIGR03790 family protein [Methylococcus sp. EFPC2]|uniref:TIGR03790 family protein n=1 Tax=Methylococcus sp. EFPC2 TaxID=2812648 RepID=UPI0019686F9E|nr:TIGR03790 family protein [Methylococcus sp. EFPC2]QSA95827.1 TIGR03790 family protein [Methylococcus sp. EFPC2]
MTVMRVMMTRYGAIAVGLLWLIGSEVRAQAGEGLPELPKAGLEASELAVVVNLDDPLSVRVGDYYRARRGIPEENLIRVHLPPNQSVLARERFAEFKAELDRLTPARVQAYALAWTRPYRVDCMSVTSAVALGFDPAYCSKQCGATKPSGYFNSASHAPWTDLKIRPAMLLAGQTFQDVKQLIERGVASDYSYPAGVGYLLNTSDKHRSVRSIFFPETVKALGDAFHLERLDADSIKGKKDVLFYFTGLAKVPDLPSLRFLPGAVADHLTSVGGALTDTKQMSSLRWLEAGATGSYGAVVEPCNHVTKFPHPGVLMWRYAEGEPLIEAYWKSVAWPGEGVFIGEPLARPFAPRWKPAANQEPSLQLFSPEWKTLRLETATSAVGPYRTAEVSPVKPGYNDVKIHLSATGFYRIAF